MWTASAGNKSNFKAICDQIRMPCDRNLLQGTNFMHGHYIIIIWVHFAIKRFLKTYIISPHRLFPTELFETRRIIDRSHYITTVKCPGNSSLKVQLMQQCSRRCLPQTEINRTSLIGILQYKRQTHLFLSSYWLNRIKMFYQLARGLYTKFKYASRQNDDVTFFHWPTILMKR